MWEVISLTLAGPRVCVFENPSMSTEVGQTLMNSKPHLVVAWPIYKSGPGTCCPMVKLLATLADFVSRLVGFGPNLAVPRRVESGQMLVLEFGQASADSWPKWPIWVEIVQSLGAHGPNVLNFDQF